MTAFANVPVHTLDRRTLGDHLDRPYRAALVLTRSRDDAEDLRNTFLSKRRAASRRPTATVALDDVEPIADRAAPTPETALANHELLDGIFRCRSISASRWSLSTSSASHTGRQPARSVHGRRH